MAVELSLLGDIVLQDVHPLRILGYSSSDLYQATELLCLPDKPNADLYTSLLQRFEDQLPFSDFDRNLSVVTAVTRNPTAPVEMLSARTWLSFDDIKQNQRWMQTSNLVKNTLTSHYYPAYLFIRYAQSFLRDLVENPSLMEHATEHKPVAPKRLEIHATDATCNYRCEMCL